MSANQNPTERRRNEWGSAREWIVILAIAALAAFLIRSYVVQTFYIPSASMSPTLLVQDRVLVNKLAYRFGDPGRGDVVVFERPPEDQDATVKDLIKRVVAVEGDTVEARDGALFVNNEQVDEPYLRAGTETLNLPPTTIAQDELFVMGDNRGNSADSRVFGPISEDLLVGEADFRIWPFGRAGSL